MTKVQKNFNCDNLTEDFIIYVLFFEKKCYVGKTINELRSRLQTHLNAAEKTENRIKTEHNKRLRINPLHKEIIKFQSLNKKIDVKIMNGKNIDGIKYDHDILLKLEGEISVMLENKGYILLNTDSMPLLSESEKQRIIIRELF